MFIKGKTSVRPHSQASLRTPENADNSMDPQLKNDFQEVEVEAEVF